VSNRAKAEAVSSWTREIQLKRHGGLGTYQRTRRSGVPASCLESVLPDAASHPPLALRISHRTACARRTPLNGAHTSNPATDKPCLRHRRHSERPGLARR
jgi:hypothetical protein